MNKVLVIATILFQLTSFAQSDEFIVLSEDNRKLGNLIVTQTNQDNKINIHVISEIIVKKLVSVSISYTLDSEFLNGKLQSNKITTYRNKRLQAIMTTTRNEDGYLFTKNGHSSQLKKFIYCESMMYYNEPVDLDEVYSEFDGVIKRIERTKLHEYELTNPDNGNISKYFYSNGLLERAIVRSPLITLYLYRKIKAE
jgi:hypothetical protein